MALLRRRRFKRALRLELLRANHISEALELQGRPTALGSQGLSTTLTLRAITAATTINIAATASAVKYAASNAWCTASVTCRAASAGRVLATTSASSMPSRTAAG